MAVWVVDELPMKLLEQGDAHTRGREDLQIFSNIFL